MIMKLLIFVAILAAALAEPLRYDNYALYKIHTRNEDEVHFLKEFSKTAVDYEFWKVPSMVHDYASVLSPPESRKHLENVLMENRIFAEVVTDNVQEALDNERSTRRKRSARSELYWTNYQTLDDINDWFDHLAQTHSGVVSTVVAGQTFQGRNLTGIRISRGRSRRAFVIEAGMVGADWLSPAVATYIVNQLVLDGDVEALQATRDFDWYIFPVSNPDGFEYSQNSVRLWYKNRRPITTAAIGVDLTKNWNSQWGVNGGSFTPGDADFMGLGPFSEPETRHLSAFIESLDGVVVGFLSLRSFGQRLVLPFAHTTDPLYNYEDMVTVGRRAMGALSVRYNTQYQVGTSSAVHDGATGNIVDYVKHRLNPPVAATFLLRDEGTWGYILPVVQVQPTCEETYDGVMAIVREAKNIGIL